MSGITNDSCSAGIPGTENSLVLAKCHHSVQTVIHHIAVIKVRVTNVNQVLKP